MEDKKALEAQGFNQNAWLIGLLAWMIPGAGHFAQKRFVRGAALGAIVIVMFVAGMSMGGVLTAPFAEDPTGSFFLQILKAFANTGNGIIYIFCLIANIGMNASPQAAESYTYEYGNTFMLVSGLLNYLVALDAYDIYVGRKE